MSESLFEAVHARDTNRARELLQRHPESVAARDAMGATALHYAAENGDRETVSVLLDAGADINARDWRFNATPAGWAIEYLRQRGGLLGIEIEDAAHAIVSGDDRWAERYLTRFPALREAVDSNGMPLKELATRSTNRNIARLFGDIE